MLTTQEKKSIEDGFMAAKDRIDDIENDSQTGFREVKATLGEQAKQLRLYTKELLNRSMEQGRYSGFWNSEESAKEFGELIFKAVGKKAMGETISSAGGVLVPEQLSAWIIQLLGVYGKFRANAFVFPVGSDKSDVPKVESDLTIYAPGEGREITKSEMTLSMVGMNIIKFCALCAFSSELEEDSLIAIGEILGMSITRSMAKKEDLIGFMGDGTDTYFGMTGIIGALRAVDAVIANIKGLKVASGNAYSEISLDDFEDVVSILPDDADDGAKWYCNRKFFFNVMHRLARGAGAADMFNILTNEKRRFFMGYPVEFISAMPSAEANSQICALLGDLKIGSYLGQRKEITIKRSDQRFFENDLIGILGIERIGIAAYGVGDTTKAGPIVGLIMASG